MRMQNTMSSQKSVLSITMSGSVTYFILSIRPLYFQEYRPQCTGESWTVGLFTQDYWVRRVYKGGDTSRPIDWSMDFLIMVTSTVSNCVDVVVDISEELVPRWRTWPTLTLLSLVRHLALLPKAHTDPSMTMVCLLWALQATASSCYLLTTHE